MLPLVQLVRSSINKHKLSSPSNLSNQIDTFAGPHKSKIKNL